MKTAAAILVEQKKPLVLDEVEIPALGFGQAAEKDASVPLSALVLFTSGVGFFQQRAALAPEAVDEDAHDVEAVLGANRHVDPDGSVGYDPNNSEIYEVAEVPELDRYKMHTIEAVIDRIVVRQPATDENGETVELLREILTLRLELQVAAGAPASSST